jgi:hypothetical protein
MINTQSMQKMADMLRKIRNPSLVEATGDKEEYQRKRKEVAKKFGVESCSALKDETERKACYAALDAAHVADHEEQVQTEAKVKHECPKCNGEGCKHCDGRGYHLEDESEDPVGKNEEVKEAVLADRDYKYDGKVIKISRKNFSKVPNDYKNSTKGKERMITYDDKAGTVSVPVQFTEEVEIEEEFWAVIDKAKGGEVMAVTTDEKGAKSSVKFSNFSKHDYHFGKDPRTLKIVKVMGKHSQKKAEKMIGSKLSFKEEVEIEEGGLYAAKEPAYPPTIDNLKKIVKDKQNLMFMFKDGRARVDLFSASAMTQVYDALKKPDHKKHFEKLIGTKAGFLQAQGFAMKMAGKGV